jgi:triphosphoribosyl-dephospho-CoA synthase
MSAITSVAFEITADASRWLSAQAVSALIEEAQLTPKPGLVDRRHRGAHSDMDYALMCRSANILRPMFHQLAEAGARMPPSPALRARIGEIGREGERVMLCATGGVNTHRGAIWALGLLVTAAAQSNDDNTNPQWIAQCAGALARLHDPHAPTHTGHKGERARREYGVGGARGQAFAGFPHVICHGLPTLQRARMRGASETSARLDALLAIMASLDDTCVLARAGLEGLRSVQTGARRILAEGGTGTLSGRRALQTLDRDMLAANISPGGSADLLAATLLLDRLEGTAASQSTSED